MKPRPASRASGAPGGRRVAVVLLGLLAALAAVYLSCQTRGGEERNAPRTGSSGKASTPKRSPSLPGTHTSSRHDSTAQGDVTSTPAKGGPRIAIVIDDLGASETTVEELEAFGVPLTYSVLPYEEETGAVVAELSNHGEELLCHLPMEPEGNGNPGPGALLESMTEAELVEATDRALEAVPGAVGVNNHMGSGLSADPRAMRPVLARLARKHLFFLDSRTSAKSVGYRLAIELGIAAAERQVFLDDVEDPQAIRVQFARLLALAKKKGAAIAIGHPHPNTIAVLADEIPKAVAAGFEIVPVSYLLDRPGELPE
ncbi:MAG TPA: divergent polysaccharide deacetylase family protein [Thermoanaerobaculia bacterium]|nr:divergent polysaccharide deacetylase family protein [Thermoanaerobaculia bacterium]